MKRRNFIKGAALGVTAAAINPGLLIAENPVVSRFTTHSVTEIDSNAVFNVRSFPDWAFEVYLSPGDIVRPHSKGD